MKSDNKGSEFPSPFDGDTVWLSIDQMAELFQHDKSTISCHIKNIFDEGELVRDSVVANFATTVTDVLIAIHSLLEFQKRNGRAVGCPQRKLLPGCVALVNLGIAEWINSTSQNA